MPLLRLLTCNLFNGNAHPAAIADILDQVAPDVVAAQELAPNAVGVIRRALPYGRLEPADDSTGVGIALRNPGTVSPFPMAQRNGLTTILEPESWPSLPHRVGIVTMHFANPIERPLGATRRIRRAQIGAVIGHVARATEPLVVMGDLNATPMWPAYRRLVRVLRDGVHDTGHAPRTWGPRWWWPRLLRIDHVLVRGGVQVVEARAVTVRGSDHSALVVDIDVS